MLNAVKFQVCTDRIIQSDETVWNVEEHQQNITYRKCYVLFIPRAAVLYQHIKLQATAKSFRSDKLRTATIENNQSYPLIGQQV